MYWGRGSKYCFVFLISDSVVVVEEDVAEVAGGVGDEDVVEGRVQCLLLKSWMLSLMLTTSKLVLL